MAKIKDVIRAIENFAPIDLQADFDNSGLKVGNTDAELSGIMITLDTNTDVVTEAIQKKCNMIIEHHPSIFQPIKYINTDLPIMQALSLAIKYDITIYSAHTNVDFCDGGLNDYVAEQIGLKNIEKINGNDSPRIGFLPSSLSLNEYAGELKKIFNDNNITTIGDTNKKISKVAIVNGGGGSDEKDLLTAVEAGADVFITGDIKYHVARLAKDLNYAIIQVGHYNSEQGFMPLIEKIIGDVIDKKIIHKASKLLNPYN